MAQPQIASGRWQPVVNKSYQWTGQCGKCGARVEAIKLSLKVLPFGRGEAWVCPSCK